MNKQFLLKMAQAKQLQFEALKEIMPDRLVEKIDNLENEIIDIGKEVILATMMDSKQTKEKQSKEDEKRTKKAQKVTIE